MTSLDRHTHTIDPVEHARLAFRTDCPYCRRARLAGKAPPGELVPARVKTSLAVGLMAASGALPAGAAAREPLTEIEPPPAAQDGAKAAPSDGSATPELPEPPEVEPPPAAAATTPPATAGSSHEPEAPANEPDYERQSEPEYEPPAAAPQRSPVTPAAPAPQAEAPPATAKPEAPAPAPAPSQPTTPQSQAPPTATQPNAQGSAPAAPAGRGERANATSPAGDGESAPRAKTPAAGEDDAAPSSNQARTAERGRESRSAGRAGAPSDNAAASGNRERRSSARARAITPSEATAATARTAGSEKAVGRTHVVQPGESLWLIAKRQLGAGASNGEIAVYVNRLWELNDTEVIRTGDPDLIYPGQEVRL